MRIRPLWIALPLVLALAAGGGVATAGPTANTATINAAKNSSYGSLLVSSTGLSLYHLASEKKGTIGCTGPCAKIWPPLLVGPTAKPNAGSGVSVSKLGTIKRPDGGLQVTYNGLALYRYKLDKKPGDVKGQGVEGIWFAVTSAGKLVKTPAAEATTSTPTTTAPGDGYGY
jgi:predicted lipoprotein with Yx(FWY)xxD motif